MAKPDLIKESLWKLMYKLSLPGILGMMVISINSIIDTVYLGNLVGTDALAGVSLLFPITLIITSVTSFIAVGSSSVLSRAIGKGNQHIQSKVLPNLIAMALLSSLFLMLTGYLFGEDAVLLLGAKGEIVKICLDYLYVYIIGIFFSIYGLSANGLIRSEGKVKQAMIYTVIAVICNLILTPVFIDSFQLGVKGAAWSSVISMFVYNLLTTIYFVRKKATFEVGVLIIKIEKEIVIDVAKIGFSALVMQVSNVIRQFIIFRTVTWYGNTHDLAVFSTIFKIFSFVSVPTMGLLQPLQPVVGVNFGAANWDRCIQAVKTFRLSGIVLMLFLLLPIWLFPEFIINLILPNETLSIVELNYLKIILLALPFLPISTSSIIFFQAIGNAKKAGLVPLLRQILLFLPLILIIPYLNGLNGIYYSLLVENFLYASILWMLFNIETQKMKSQIAAKN
ncbi:MAG: hypothetical protein CMO01_05970 [Thalassobius sp.]|nr:hypothetical protein [Thalassovita sp.]